MRTLCQTLVDLLTRVQYYGANNIQNKLYQNRTQIMHKFDPPFNGLTIESAIFLLSYPDMLSCDAVLFLADSFTDEDFNESRWNSLLVKNLRQFNIFFDFWNNFEFENNDKIIHFNIVDDICINYTLKSLNGDILLERTWNEIV